MQFIELLYGLPGSGKSKYAKEKVREDSTYKRVNKDDIRELLFSSVFNKENEKLTINIRDTLIYELLNKGYNVIVDDTNFPFGGEHYQTICNIAKNHGNVMVIEKYIDIDLETAIKNNKGEFRKEIPENVIINMYNKYIKNKNYQTSSVFFEKSKKVENNSNLQNCVIVDIDGTLAYNTNRNIYDYDNVITDDVNKNLVYLLNSLQNVQILLLTGRPEDCRKQTKEWLYKNNINYHVLFMRDINNNESDFIIKQKIYNQCIKPLFNCLCIFEDRKRNIDMWRGIGLEAYQVKYGNY